MKTLSTFLLACCCTGIVIANFGKVNAQSLQIVGDTIQSYKSSCKVLAEYPVPVRNVSSAPIKVRVRKEYITITPKQEVYFCWVVCYNSSVMESPDPGSSETAPEIPPGMDINKFIAYVDPRLRDDVSGEIVGYVEGVSEVRYHFYNEDEPSDKATLVIRVDVSCATGVDEGSTDKSNTIVLPNPADESARITFSEPFPFAYGKLQLFDALGMQCGGMPLHTGDKEAIVSTFELPSGVYSYTIVSDKGVIYTRGTFSVAR